MVSIRLQEMLIRNKYNSVSNREARNTTARFANLRLSATFLLLCQLLISFYSTAQTSPKISASLDTSQIRIGEQIELSLSAEIPSGSKIRFPLVPDTVHGFEVVKRTSIDTVPGNDKSILQLMQRLHITSFDSGYYVLEPFQFIFQKDHHSATDTLSTEAFLIRVNSVPVDTTQAIKDIKPVLDPGIDWNQVLLWSALVLLLIGVILSIYRYFKRRKKTPEFIPLIPKIPPHEKALAELDRIEAEKLWQQGLYKKYQSAVADTVRLYIEERFQIPAMELPSDDTLLQFRGIKISAEAIEKLTYLLHLADMVKFAKTIPVGEENERAINDARTFIQLTRPLVKEDFTGKEEQP